jgi:hypothetical protein
MSIAIRPSGRRLLSQFADRGREVHPPWQAMASARSGTPQGAAHSSYVRE